MLVLCILDLNLSLRPKYIQWQTDGIVQKQFKAKIINLPQQGYIAK